MIRKTISRLLATAKRASVRSKPLYYLYSLTIGRCFTREIGAVYAGFEEYRRRCGGNGGSEFRLRRNVHRLEKGLIMQPLRPVFARDYIHEVVSDFTRLWAASGDDGQRQRLRWSRDVLTRYFATVTTDEQIDEQRRLFEAALQGPFAEVECVPRARKQYTPTTLTYEAFLELARVRRSVRWYLPRPVERDLIDKAVVAAALSPSACNRQPFHFRIFDEPEKVARVAAIPGGTAGFNHQFPAIVVLVGDLSAYCEEGDRHIIYIDASLAAMSFMLALETLGLSSCAINWPDIPSRENMMIRELDLRPYERPVMLISLGYADPEGGVPYSDKKALDTIRSYNR